MYHSARPFLLALMLAAIAARTVFGAPCCLDLAMAAAPADHHAQLEHAGHYEHAEHGADVSSDPHSDHGGDPASNPCCSACGPTLPPANDAIASPAFTAAPPEAAPIRALATRPPFPAYDATGPPLLT